MYKWPLDEQAFLAGYKSKIANLPWDVKSYEELDDRLGEILYQFGRQLGCIYNGPLDSPRVYELIDKIVII